MVTVWVVPQKNANSVTPIGLRPAYMSLHMWAGVSTNMHRKLLEGKGRGRKRREGQGMEARSHFFLFP